MTPLSEMFPEKPGETAELAEEIEYTRQLHERVGTEIIQSVRGWRRRSLFDRMTKLISQLHKNNKAQKG